MGGRSESSSTEQSTQNTTQFSSDGVVNGPLFQGGGAITYTDQFPEGVQKAFQQLIDLTGNALQGAKDIGSAAIETVSERVEQVDNPELATLTKLMPALMLGIAALAVVMIWRK